MEKEENVYGQNHTGEFAAAKMEREGAQEKEVSAVLGKFKDVDALARAYGALQSEFTRRSQRLKELEKRLENFAGGDDGGIGEKAGVNAAEMALNADTGAPKCEKDGASEAENAAESARGSGAEKLRKNAEARREQAKAFDEFVLDTESQESAQARPNGDGDLPLKSADTDGEALAENALKKAAESAATSIAGSGSAEGAAEALYQKVSQDENLRLRIIGEYLASIGRSAAPLTVGGAGTLTAPPLKAKSIGDAGSMALQYFKKPVGND